MPTIFVDADACPVKEEVYRVAMRHGLKVKVVANSRMWTPPEDWLELVVVDKGFDEADDWIVGQVETDDIVVSNDIPMADRCLKKGAQVIAPTGHVYTPENICATLATRDLLCHLRDNGTIEGGGPPPFTKKDRSRFLTHLDEMIRAIRRKPGIA